MPPGALAAIVLDCRHAAPLARFWAEALGWAVRPYDDAEVARLAALGHTPETDPTVAVDAPDGSLTLFCVEVPEPRSVKNRMHLDVQLTGAAHLDRLLSLGATVLDRQPGWTVLADPEGNELCAIEPVREPE
ncbi:MAG TPA: VOC family protein [Micromonosporaceae bacterium]|nr:VOC family protein [Micromonosporaceae bacterium]